MFAADASTRDQPSRLLPWMHRRSQGETRLLAGPISAVCEVRLHQWVRVDVWPHALDHGTTHVLTLVERVQAGALLLVDRGSFSFAFFDHLVSRGIWGIGRFAHQASAQVSHICGQADGVFDAIVSPLNLFGQPGSFSCAPGPMLAPRAAFPFPDHWV